MNTTNLFIEFIDTNSQLTTSEISGRGRDFTSQYYITARTPTCTCTLDLRHSQYMCQLFEFFGSVQPHAGAGRVRLASSRCQQPTPRLRHDWRHTARRCERRVMLPDGEQRLPVAARPGPTSNAWIFSSIAACDASCMLERRFMLERRNGANSMGQTARMA